MKTKLFSLPYFVVTSLLLALSMAFPIASQADICTVTTTASLSSRNSNGAILATLVAVREMLCPPPYGPQLSARISYLPDAQDPEVVALEKTGDPVMGQLLITELKNFSQTETRDFVVYFNPEGNFLPLIPRIGVGPVWGGVDVPGSAYTFISVPDEGLIPDARVDYDYATNLTDIYAVQYGIAIEAP